MFARKIHPVTIFITLLTLACAAAYAQPDPAVHARNGQIEGTWIVDVDLISPPPFLPEAFTALETYARGGGMVTANDMQQGPGQGSWARQGDDYVVTILFFTKDAAGATNGSIKVRHRVTLAGRDEYSGVGNAEVFDAAGNFAGSVAFHTQGRRLAAE